jgi:hypothetical protein
MQLTPMAVSLKASRLFDLCPNFSSLLAMSQVISHDRRNLTEVKQIIHIELCEAEFKRRKVELEKGKEAYSTMY